MELHILDHSQHRLPCASLSRTLTLSTPDSRCAKIASYTLHLPLTPTLINCVLETVKIKLGEINKTIQQASLSPKLRP